MGRVELCNIIVVVVVVVVVVAVGGRGRGAADLGALQPAPARRIMQIVALIAFLVHKSHIDFFFFL